jgi:hypothetical protein
MTLPRLAPTLLLLAALAGCGTPSQPLPMAITAADGLQLRGWVPDAFKRQVGLAAVEGGEETGRWWGSKVSAAALGQALADSLHTIGMGPVAPEPAPRFELRAKLLELQQPLVAADVTVNVAVAYTLVETASGRVVFQRRISNTDKAGFTEALLSQPERTRLANERALRTNISMLLHELVALQP